MFPDETAMPASLDHHLPSLLTAAVTHHRSGRPAQAGALCARVLALTPSRGDALLLMGSIQGASGDDGTAMRLFMRALAVGCADAVTGLFMALRNCAVRSGACGAVEDAIRLQTAAVTLFPDRGEDWARLADLLYTAARPAFAEKVKRRGHILTRGGTEAQTAVNRVSIGGQTATWLNEEIAGRQDGWYRGRSINYYPAHRDRSRERDLEQMHRNVLAGWVPDKPFLTKDMMITAFGSCFAQRVENHLRQRGYRTSIGEYGNPESSNYWSESLIIKCGEGFVNTFSIATQFQWIYCDVRPSIRIWHKSEGIIKEYIDSNRDAARAILDQTSCFVITLGLAEVWYDKVTNEVLWTAVPKKHFDEERHGFRVTTVQENLDNLRNVLDIVRTFRGSVPVILTISPVPLWATFRNVSCITASCVSKSILRVAVDELMRERADDPDLYYFPSYELITQYFQDPWDEDGVHPSEDAVKAVMTAFETYFCR
jgi:hypothetical protein